MRKYAILSDKARVNGILYRVNDRAICRYSRKKAVPLQNDERAISLTDHGIVEAERSVLLVLSDEFAIVIIRNQFLYGLTIGVERLEPLWRDGSSEIFRRVLKIVK